MTDLISIVGSGGAKPWIYLPAAVLLGALHGLEPGHSKTLMAAFIVAIRGTVKQAALLGLAATLSHTIVVWVVALGGMWLLQGLDAGVLEPYFQLALRGHYRQHRAVDTLAGMGKPAARPQPPS